MRIIDAVRRPGVPIEADRTIRDAAVLMESTGLGALVVCDGGEPVGMVTDRDLVRRALAKGLDPEGRVDGVMTMPLETIDAEADLHDAVQVFGSKAVRRLAVVDDGTFVGVVAVDDLVIDLASDLAAVARPLTAEAVFAHHDATVPAAGPRVDTTSA